MDRNDKDIKGAVERALAELDAAHAHHAECEAENRATSSRLTSAVNRLNQAQKTVDEQIARLKKERAPWNTDWSSRTKGVAVS